MNTEYETFIDSITCEEYYNSDYEIWLEEIHLDFVNLELQMIAEENKNFA